MQSYIYVVLLITTVPVYQFIIMRAYFFLRKIEVLSTDVNCNGVAYATKHRWIYVEILGFWGNLVQLMIGLLGQL